MNSRSRRNETDMRSFTISRASGFLVVGALLASTWAACVTGADSGEEGEDTEGSEGEGSGVASNAGSCPTSTTQDVQAAKDLIVQRCNGCHNFNPDSPSGSVYSRSADGSMPPSNPLSSAEVEQIRALVACSGGSGTTASPSGEDGEEEGEGDD